MNAAVPESDPRWQLTLEVVNSPAFERSPRLRAFLLFICELELSGRRLEINEQLIGIHVFGRAPGYNPGDDSIVRSQARLLRQRLEEYFRSAGRTAAMRIEIPKGSYVPFFEANVEPEPVAAAVPPPVTSRIEPPPSFEPPIHIPPPVSSATEEVRSRKSGRWILGVIALLVFIGAAISLTRILRPHAQPQDLETRFWSRLFDPSRRAVIVPADSTLILIEELTEKPVNLAHYLNHDDLRSLDLLRSTAAIHPGDLESSQYTSMADLNLVARLMTVPELSRSRVQVRYARELSMSDAKEDNLILIGGERANPWVELFAPGMNFAVDYNWSTRQNTVVNKAPHSGESATYAEGPDGPQSSAYGLIAFQPSLDHQGDTLLVSGTTSAGTQLAADFLLNARTLDQFLQSIAKPDGSIPHFELLLVGRNLGGSVPTWSIVAYRTKT
ncbi:hypothetical protein [Silvibacterium dinghuense]|uniref:Adenylate cyclase n=1 Tax=Silvibacterium dinghuense TaxID=1560006 RepID=A0A4Q1SCL5_9BACT|nr:hypothetical protein [Silvibacterium dinghuense]RXS94530.1 hypothetical protein ESZ00_15805 [Silvibacterium dinghuense]GGH15545.1 hypothetical protein GCM10011586_36700 [Silvibacterium dinghuense]